MTHCSPASDPPISCWIDGRATFTMVTSSWITKKPRHTERRAPAPARLPGGAAVPAPGPAGACPAACCLVSFAMRAVSFPLWVPRARGTRNRYPGTAF